MRGGADLEWWLRFEREEKDIEGREESRKREMQTKGA